MRWYSRFWRDNIHIMKRRGVRRTVARGWWGYRPEKSRARAPAKLLVAFAVLSCLLAPGQATAQGAITVPSTTNSYYERTANARALYLQGEQAGKNGAQGIVILDFGRPGYDGADFGTMAYNGAFVPFSSIATAVESYISAYYRWAPAGTSLDVAIGTNNSCGTGQPCGAIANCGCPDEPLSFFTWGAQLGDEVEEVGAWASSLREVNRYTDDVRVVAADDAEPAYDPAYINTYDVLAGYASAVDGKWPAMVDYGSADGFFWTESQLLQVAYGFPPDVPMPQIYYPFQAEQWGALLSFAKTQRRELIDIFGVLTTGAGTNPPSTAYVDMLGAAEGVTDQDRIPWLSTINR